MRRVSSAPSATASPTVTVTLAQHALRFATTLLALGAAWFVASSAGLAGGWGALVPTAPVAALAAAMLLAARFRKERIFLALVVIGAWTVPMTLGPADLAAVHWAALVVPLSLAVLAWLPEAELTGPWGLVRLAAAVGPAAAHAYAPHWGAGGLEALLEATGWPEVATALAPYTPLPPVAVATGVGAALVIAARGITARRPVAGPSIGLLAAAVLAVHVAPDPAAVSAFLTAAALVCVVTLVQTSWRMAYVDELTGLPGRRALEEALDRLGRRYAVAMVDVDHFKKFNDTYGHEAGDQVLRMVGAKLRAVEGGGRAYRYGGEEFTVVFPGAEPREVVPALEALRQAIEAGPFVLRGPERPARKRQGRLVRGVGGGKTVRVTASIGVAGRVAATRDPREVVKAADKALYRAKKKGRNQVCAG